MLILPLLPTIKGICQVGCVGGAGFPTGLKWSLYLLLTEGHVISWSTQMNLSLARKDIPFLMANPSQLLIEGMIIRLMAIGGHHGFIYLRRSRSHIAVFLAAVREARAAGYLGKGLGPKADYDLEITVHAGAGAYIWWRRDSIA